MKSKTFIHLLIFAALALSACSPAIRVIPETPVSPQDSQTQTEVLSEPQAEQDIEGKCVRNSDETRLLIDMVHGYCLQYPAEYDIAYPNENEIMLIKRSILNVSEPRVHIEVQPANGASVEQAADQLVADYSVPGMEVTRTPLTIDGEVAIMLDGLSGQEINRQLVVVHGNRLYHLMFLPMDKSQAEVFTKSEVLYNTLTRSFNFRPDTNACPDCPPPSEGQADQTAEDVQTASINGWVWHDLCDSGKDGEPAPETTPAGCVKEDTALGPYHADGLLAVNEPLIEGVVVTLGEGACPSTGLAEQSTITTDLSFSFTGLKAGTYCVSIDPQREPNLAILRPGVWTYPAIEQGVISTTVTLTTGEYKGMVNFGWDYQFLP